MRAKDGPAREPFFLATVLVIAICAVYAGSLTGPFVLDDLGSISQNPSIRHLWDVKAVFSPPAQGLTVSGRPLLNLSLAINYAVGGLSVRGYHLFNLAVHAAAALTLFGLIRRTLNLPSMKARWGDGSAALAFASAVIWALHPLQTESVTYVIQRAESLMALCYLLTLYCWVRQWWVGSVVCCLCGMATKEVMVSAPLIVLLYDRTFLSGSFRAAWRERGRCFAALSATWCVLGLLVFANGNRGGTVGFGSGVSAPAYWLDQCLAVLHYLRLAFWPHPLVFDYGPPQPVPWGRLVPAGGVVLALGAGTVYALRRPSALGFCGAWFFAILAPTSLIPGYRQTWAEHRMELALAPLAGCVVCATYRWVRAARFGRAGLTWAAVFAGIAVVLGALTIRRNRDYRTDVALWTTTVADRPGNAYAQSNLGNALLRAGRTDEAIARFQQAVRLNPKLAEARSYLAGALLTAGRPTEAAAECAAALRLSPDFAPAHSNLGMAMAMAGRTADAITQYRQAIAADPAFAEAHFNLGDALLAAGRPGDAAQEFAACAQLRPEDAAAYNNWGYALATARRLPEAIAEYTAALNADPSYAIARFNRGNARFDIGAMAPAIQDYTEALRARPADAQIHYSLGVALAQVGRLPEALQHVQEALRLRPDFPAAADYLARLHAALGR